MPLSESTRKILKLIAETPQRQLGFISPHFLTIEVQKVSFKSHSAFFMPYRAIRPGQHACGPNFSHHLNRMRKKSEMQMQTSEGIQSTFL